MMPATLAQLIPGSAYRSVVNHPPPLRSGCCLHRLRGRSVVLRSQVETAQRPSSTPTSAPISSTSEASQPPPSFPPPAGTGFGVTKAALVELVKGAFDNHGVLPLPESDAAAAPAIVDHLAKCLDTSLLQGLVTSEEGMAVRVKAFGANRLPPRSLVSFWQLAYAALQDTTVLMLLAAGAASLGLAAFTQAESSDWIEGWAILASVMIVVGVSATTNYAKEGKFRELNKLKDDVLVRVVRDGTERSISTYDLLVGDVALVETGDILAADGVLFQGADIRLDESHMTGESDEVVRGAIGSSLVLCGSKVLEGVGRMLVLAVGPNTQQGRLNTLVLDSAKRAGSPNGSEGGGEQETNLAAESLGEDTFLTQKLDELAQQIGAVGIIAAVSVLVINCASFTSAQLGLGVLPFTTPENIHRYLEFVITSITLLVVAVPEGLPLAVTLALAFSVQRMLGDKNLVRNLNSCETMACATTICSDKTGTLTQNDMTVARVWAGGFSYRVRPESSSPAGSTKARELMQRSYDAEHPFNSSRDLDHSRSSRDSELSRSSRDPDHSRSSRDMDFSRSSWDNSTLPVASLASSSSVAAALSSGTPSALAPGLELRPDHDPESPHVELPSHLQQLMRDSIALNSTSMVSYDIATGKFIKAGNRTECGLLEFAMRMGDEIVPLETLRAQSTVIKLIPFTSQRKCMSVLVARPEAIKEAVKEVGHPSGASNGGNTSNTSSGSNASASNDASNGTHKLHATMKEEPGHVTFVPPEDGAGTKWSPLPARVFTKGAAELVLQHCQWQVTGSGQIVPLKEEQKASMLESFGKRALRTLALAYKDITLCVPESPMDTSVSSLSIGDSLSSISMASTSMTASLVSSAATTSLQDANEEPRSRLRRRALAVPKAQMTDEVLAPGLVLVGLVGLEDPLRLDVPKAIEQCSRAGIVVRMLTGDNARTATSIARQCGIIPKEVDIPYMLKQSARMHRVTAGSGGAPSRRGARGSSLPAATDGSALSDSDDAHSSDEGSVSVVSWGNATSSRSPTDDDAEAGAVPAGAKKGGDRRMTLGLSSSVYLPSPLPDCLALEGPQFRELISRPDGSLDRDSFRAIWPRLRVLARCSPTDKYMLVSALRTLRTEGTSTEVVAMTGDGTNDAPALSVADVGFAMNSGTSIAKDAADILLMDDNFSSIVSAVKWGRNVYDSVTKFLQFQLTANVVAVLTAGSGALVLQQSPLSATQMLWVNLIMDALASLSLATEEPNDAMLDMAPTRREQPLISPTVAKHIAGQSVYQLTVLGALVFGGGLVRGAVGAPDDLTLNTLVFNTFVVMQLFNQLNCRRVHDERNVLSGLRRQPLFLGILAAEGLLQAAIVQWGGPAFQTTPLTPAQWAFSIGFGATTLLVRAGLARAIPTEPPRGAQLQVHQRIQAPPTGA